MAKRLLLFLASFLISVFMIGCSADTDAPPVSKDKPSVETTAKTQQHADGDKNENAKKEKPGKEEKKSEENKPKKKLKTQKQQDKQAAKVQKLDNLTVHFIDVGQGDAALLEYSHKGTPYKTLIDSGDWQANDAVSYLNDQGVKKLDLLVGTHPHADHIGQMDKVLNSIKVDEVWMSGDTTTSNVFERVLDAIESNDVGYNEPRAGDTYKIGPLHIQVLSSQNINGELNNDSIVMKMTSLLFTGDAEANAESGILSRKKSNIRADILKTGHHGSRTSTTPGFLDAVQPKMAIISAGENNKYGHPDEEVVSRLKANNIKTYATFVHGTIIVKTDGKKYTVKTQKDGTVKAQSKKQQSSKGAAKSAQGPSSHQKQTSKKESESNSNCVDINNASREQLEQIIHIGPVRSADVIDARPYQSVDDLTRIKGIGPSRIADIKTQGLACIK